ncbi:MAG: DUF2357 domain-containing protein [Balneolales bacterium]|nr:DUF2357 domain-containing protein [Balneolales bacterium]
MPRPDLNLRYVESLEIDLSNIAEGLILRIDERTQGTLCEQESEQTEVYEAHHQLMEGHFYDYSFNLPELHFDTSKKSAGRIVRPRVKQPNMGTLEPGIFVGTLSLFVIQEGSPANPAHKIRLEVQSLKTGYRDDYRNMLEYITEKCSALLMQSESPIDQTIEVDHNAPYETLYQRFAFIRSVVGSEEFAAAVHKIVTAPVTGWKEIPAAQDIRNMRRFSGSDIRQITRGSNRQNLQSHHPLRQQGIDTLPSRISSSMKSETVNVPENRFVKHALETFLKFCSQIHEVAKKSPDSELYRESAELINILETQLQHSVFSDISQPTSLRTNSPVLQRKPGYREILRAWIMFDLAARLIWSGGNDVYEAGKKDIATLYEYWLFFQLLDLLSSTFQIGHVELEKLIVKSKNGLNLSLKQGSETALNGTYRSKSRNLNVRFSYNRTFSGAKADKSYPQPGSWTRAMRPDYSLSIWPSGISESEAEDEELIVHIHFDAKYKVENLADYLKRYSEADSEELSKEKQEEKEGNYKSADLLKMHAYKDAIRRTGGAYVLYPGDRDVQRRGFHEIIPGLGAFPVKPGKDETGITELQSFIIEVTRHYINRVSQREKKALKTFEIYKSKPSTQNKAEFVLPEAYGKNRSMIPDETHVLVGFCQSKQLDWIRDKRMYNFRAGDAVGAIPIDLATVSARFLLLHHGGEKISGELWRITSQAPVIWDREKMLLEDYPNPGSSYYLIVEIEPVRDTELVGLKWDISQLKNYRGYQRYLPFTTTLTELMENRVTGIM